MVLLISLKAEHVVKLSVRKKYNKEKLDQMVGWAR